MLIANTRRAVIDGLVNRAREDSRIALVCADSLKSMKAQEFYNLYPERYFDVGIAEQNAVGFAAGLAASGFMPFVATYAGFITMRACEQIRTYVAYPGLNVKFIGANGGLYGGEREGVTHQFFEDLGIIRSIPGIDIIIPADAYETYQATMVLTEREGPAYLRVGSGKEPLIFEKGVEFEFGKARIIKETGNDAGIFVSGPILKRALTANSLLEEKGIKTTVVEIHTLKPIDDETVTTILGKTGAAVTVEDHNIIGGLGSTISEVSTSRYPVPIVRVGLKDIYPESGEAEELLDKYRMGVKDIVDAVEKVIAMK